MHKLRNKVMAYDWGSRTAIASLLGRAVPSPGPEAEMWIGAHAAGPSVIEGVEEENVTLADMVARAPEVELGAEVCARFGDRLPFLLKVLAADVPLSLQAHPDPDQARAGFEREEALGIPLDARHRCYRDASHKPEVLCALGPFEALCGFRPREETLELFARLDVAGLEEVAAPLRSLDGADGMKAAFAALMNMDASRASALVQDVAAACRRETPRGGAHVEWALRLAEMHPGDPGVVASLMLNLVRLEAGEALSLDAGSLHSYLRGAGIELMASSDNVLRGGLTTKHVDVPELLSILHFREEAVRPVRTRSLSDFEAEYVTDTEDFRLTRIATKRSSVCRPDRRGPELLLCVSGAARVSPDSGESIDLNAGESLYVRASESAYELSGAALLFRATVGAI